MTAISWRFRRTFPIWNWTYGYGARDRFMCRKFALTDLIKFHLIMLFFNLMKGKPCAVTFARWQTVTRTRSSRMSCSAWSTTSVFRTIQGLVNTDNTCSYKTEDVIKSAKMKTKTRPLTKVSFLLLPVTKEPSPQYTITLKYWFITGLFHRKSHDEREL